MIRRVQLSSEPFRDSCAAVLRLIAELIRELPLCLVLEQSDILRAVIELSVGERNERIRTGTAPGFWSTVFVERLTIAWVRSATVSLITAFRSDDRKVCLVITDFAETVMIAPLPRRLRGPGERVTGMRTRYSPYPGRSVKSSPALMRRNWFK